MLGVDSITPVTADIISKVTTMIGQTPAFWGRYFSAPDTQRFGEYRHITETPPLRAAGIPVLPIARQTLNVGGTQALGETDGHNNGLDILDQFGLRILQANHAGVFVFLDVEMPDKPGGVNLTPTYLTGWTTGLKQAGRESGVHFRPCVYSSLGNADCWKVMQNSGLVEGLWVAAYPKAIPSTPTPNWTTARTQPKGFTACPTFLWQYKGNVENLIDLNVTSPTQGDVLLASLVHL